MWRWCFVACAIGTLALSPPAWGAPADRDPTFGGDGDVDNDFFPRGGPGREPKAVQIQPDGKIVVAGEITGGLAVIRYLPNGIADPDFGNGGVAIVEGEGANPVVRDLAIARDGDVLVAGGTGGEGSDLLVVRLDPDGTPEEDFGDSGSLITALGARELANSVALAADDRILLGGLISTDASRQEDRYVMALYTADGVPEDYFGVEGVVIGADPSGEVTDLAFADDGNIVASVSRRVNVHPSRDVGSVRAFQPDGSPESAFGNSGKAPIRHRATALDIDGEGRILVGGSDHGGFDFRLSRLNAGGRPSKTFNRNARVPIFDRPGVRAARVIDLDIDEDNRVVQVGHFAAGQSGGDSAAIARYLDNGVPDPTFGSQGNGGVIDDGLRQGTGVAIQPDGKIVVTGPGGEPDGEDFGTIRLRGGTVPNEPPDTIIEQVDSTSPGRISVRFRGEDDFTPPAAITFECRLNRGAWTLCASPHHYRDLAEGVYTVRVRAIAAGARDPSPARVRLRVAGE
jgi:uncharacterized delta-60 repeat protein